MSVQVHMHVNRRSELDYRLYLYTMFMLLSALCILHCWILTTTILQTIYIWIDNTHNFKQASQLQQQGVRISNSLVTINCNCCVVTSLLVVAAMCRWGNEKMHLTTLFDGGTFFSLLTTRTKEYSITPPCLLVTHSLTVRQTDEIQSDSSLDRAKDKSRGDLTKIHQ